MTKSDLINRLDEFDDDAVVVFVDCNGGWCNLQDVTRDGNSIAIHEETDPPFHARE